MDYLLNLQNFFDLYGIICLLGYCIMELSTDKSEEKYRDDQAIRDYLQFFAVVFILFRCFLSIFLLFDSTRSLIKMCTQVIVDMKAFFSLLMMSIIMFAVIQVRLFHSNFEIATGLSEDGKVVYSIHEDNTFSE